MGRSQESFFKKEVRNKKEKKRKEKEAKRLAKRENDGKTTFDDMIAYVDANGVISATPPEESPEKINAEDIEVSVPRSIETEEDPLRKGIVTFKNESKGFGFIKDLKTSQDLYFHQNDAHDQIREGNLVSFEIEKRQRGLAAFNIRISKQEQPPDPSGR